MGRRSEISCSDSGNATKLRATGILMAGGKNSRMQKNKAFLELGGRSLVEHSLEVLQTVFAEVLISSNQPELFESYGVRVIPDLIRDQGPLGGLYSGLRAAAYEVSFFMACDMPFVQSNVIRHLAQYVEEFEIVVPQGELGLHPLHAFYRRSCLPSIKKSLEAHCLKVIDFYANCRVRYVEFMELVPYGNVLKTFCNINTPEEWANVQQLDLV
ncbi:MAG: molybdenum cofactor guanylyltransferase [Desulfitobacteriaceae bacterium]